MEEWRPVVGWEGIYEVSNLGRVKSLERRAWNPACARFRIVPSKIMKPYFAVGYPYLSLRKDNIVQKKAVHCLVADAFIGPRPGKADVCHADGNRANPAADNLRYASRSENNLDRRAHGTSPCGEKAWNSIITHEQAVAIKADPRSSREIAESLGLLRSHVASIKSGRIWAHLP